MGYTSVSCPDCGTAICGRNIPQHRYSNVCRYLREDGRLRAQGFSPLRYRGIASPAEAYSLRRGLPDRCRAWGPVSYYMGGIDEGLWVKSPFENLSVSDVLSAATGYWQLRRMSRGGSRYPLWQAVSEICSLPEQTVRNWLRAVRATVKQVKVVRTPRKRHLRAYSLSSVATMVQRSIDIGSVKVYKQAHLERFERNDWFSAAAEMALLPDGEITRWEVLAGIEGKLLKGGAL